MVIPLYSLNLIIPALLGIFFLHEAVTVSKVLGLAFAGVAMVLLSR